MLVPPTPTIPVYVLQTYTHTHIWHNRNMCANTRSFIALNQPILKYFGQAEKSISYYAVLSLPSTRSVSIFGCFIVHLLSVRQHLHCILRFTAFPPTMTVMHILYFIGWSFDLCMIFSIYTKHIQKFSQSEIFHLLEK